MLDVEKTDKNLVTRRKDPNYVQVTAMVTKDLAKRLKIYCASAETTITETVEQALEEFLAKQKKEL